jgi:DNA polymerase
MLVGEQPGDVEDREGRPFVGPAGKLLDKALAEAGIDRQKVYMTNAVKHFKFEERGKRRIHAKPNTVETRACHPWLDAEIEVLRPDVIVCLGATAAQALLGMSFRVTKQRGIYLPYEKAPNILATVHPSSILRAPADRRYRGVPALHQGPLFNTRQSPSGKAYLNARAPTTLSGRKLRQSCYGPCIA